MGPGAIYAVILLCGFLPMQHINNCWAGWCSQLQGAIWVWNIAEGKMKNGGDLKVLQGSGYEVLFGVGREIEVFKSPLR